MNHKYFSFLSSTSVKHTIEKKTVARIGLKKTVQKISLDFLDQYQLPLLNEKWKVSEFFPFSLM